MRTSDFEYELPPGLIAQRPANPRDSSRLMILNRKTDQVEHRSFGDLPGYLQRGDALVINQTRVIPARIKGRKLPGGGSVEILLLKEINASMWEAIVGGRGLIQGERLRSAMASWQRSNPISADQSAWSHFQPRFRGY